MRTCRIVDFAVPVDHKEKRNKYFNLSKVVRKLWNMRVTVIAVVIGALRTVFRGFQRES